MQQIHYKDYIEVNPEVRFGKAVIKGTRITVYDVLQYYFSNYKIFVLLSASFVASVLKN